MRHALLVISLAACHPIHPWTTLAYHDDGQPLVVGATVEALANWTARCQTKGGFWSDSDPEYTECHVKPVRLEVTCTGPCAVERPMVEDHDSARIAVKALAPGRVVVEAKSTRLDKHKTQVKRFELDVMPPQRLGLECTDKYDGWDACSPVGVPATKPWVRPHILVRNEEQKRVTVRVNGVPRGVGRSMSALSLAELYPDAKTEGGIAPGVYLVELELAGMVERFQVTAR